MPKEPSPQLIDRLRVRHLKLLETIHDTGSLGATARLLGLTQPAVTLLLQDLEAAFAVRLVQRDVRGGRLTEAGLVALVRLRVALSALDQAVLVSRQREPIHSISVGCSQFAGIEIVPAACANLETDYLSKFRYAIEEGEAASLIQRMYAHELDCFVGWSDSLLYQQVDINELDVTPLGTETLHVAARSDHPLARQRSISVGDLGKYGWVLPAEHSRTFGTFRRLFVDKAVVPPACTVQCTSIQTCVRIAAKTNLLTLAPSSVINHYQLSLGISSIHSASLATPASAICVISLKVNASLPPLVALREALIAAAPATGLTPR